MIIIKQHPDENTVNDLRYIVDRVREVLYALEGSSDTAQSDAYIASVVKDRFKNIICHAQVDKEKSNV